jgi:signal transduction histidine kinase
VAAGLDAAVVMADNSRVGGEGVEAPEADETRALDELRVEVGQLRASRTRLVLAADAERREIERALHDGLQQQLVGLAADLELASRSVRTDPETAMRQLADVRRDVALALEEVRTLAHRVYPPLEVGGLVAALRFAAANAGVRARIDVAIDSSVPAEVAGALYFCCLDALEHAAGSGMTIRVGEQEGRLTLEIAADRDVSADPSAARDRVEALGGGLSVRSEPGGPTAWALFLPVPG